MTNTQLIERMRNDRARHIKLLSEALKRIDVVGIQDKDCVSLIESLKIAIADDPGYAIPVLDPCGRFESADFYAGAMDVLNYLTKVAEGTQGAEVWRSLFVTSRLNMISGAKEKGFNIK